MSNTLYKFIPRRNRIGSRF